MSPTSPVLLGQQSSLMTRYLPIAYRYRTTLLTVFTVLSKLAPGTGTLSWLGTGTVPVGTYCTVCTYGIVPCNFC